jgi:hypothetical protein
VLEEKQLLVFRQDEKGGMMREFCESKGERHEPRSWKFFRQEKLSGTADCRGHPHTQKG